MMSNVRGYLRSTQRTKGAVAKYFQDEKVRYASIRLSKKPMRAWAGGCIVIAAVQRILDGGKQSARDSHSYAPFQPFVCPSRRLSAIHPEINQTLAPSS
jgi:hypothetical protein